MGFCCAVSFCPRAKFHMSADDDFYISSKDLFKYSRNPVNYPEYLEETDEALRKLARLLSSTISSSKNEKVTCAAAYLAAASEFSAESPLLLRPQDRTQVQPPLLVTNDQQQQQIQLQQVV